MVAALCHTLPLRIIYLFEKPVFSNWSTEYIPSFTEQCTFRSPAVKFSLPLLNKNNPLNNLWATLPEDHPLADLSVAG